MTDATFKGVDGVARGLEAHRAHLQAELDLAVDASSPRFDEGFASRLRAELHTLPKRKAVDDLNYGIAIHRRRQQERAERAARHARERQASSASVKPKLTLVFDGEGDVAVIEEFLAAGPDAAHDIIASGRKKLKANSLLRRVLRTMLAAKVERYP